MSASGPQADFDPRNLSVRFSASRYPDVVPVRLQVKSIAVLLVTEPTVYNQLRLSCSKRCKIFSVQSGGPCRQVSYLALLLKI